MYVFPIFSLLLPNGSEWNCCFKGIKWNLSIAVLDILASNSFYSTQTLFLICLYSLFSSFIYCLLFFNGDSTRRLNAIFWWIAIISIWNIFFLILVQLIMVNNMLSINSCLENSILIICFSLQYLIFFQKPQKHWCSSNSNFFFFMKYVNNYAIFSLKSKVKWSLSLRQKQHCFKKQYEIENISLGCFILKSYLITKPE